MIGIKEVIEREKKFAARTGSVSFFVVYDTLNQLICFHHINSKGSWPNRAKYLDNRIQQHFQGTHIIIDEVTL